MVTTQSQNNALCDPPRVSANAPRLRLRVRMAEGTITCETAQPITLVGSRKDCELPINSPDVSKVHCAIVHTGESLLVCDLCSRSGTFVNGRSVRVRRLVRGDCLRVGPVVIETEFIGSDPNRAETPPLGTRSADGLRVVPQDGQILFTRNREVGAGVAIDLTGSVALVGRRGTCDIRVDTPDVSLVNTLLFAFEGRPVVVDLGSRLGTALNGAPVQLAWLRDGDELGVGGVKLRVVCDATVTTVSGAAAEGASALENLANAARHAQDAQAIEGLLTAVLDDMTQARAKLDHRASELDQREAEMDALAALLRLQFDHIRALREALANRENEVKLTAEEARQRLAQTLRREQLALAGLEELERRQELRAVAYHPADVATAPPASPKADLPGLPDKPPVARPFPLPNKFFGADRSSVARPNA